MLHSTTRIASDSLQSSGLLDLVHLRAPSYVALFHRDGGFQKRRNDLRSELGPDHSSAEAQDIDAIVLDSLVCGVCVVDGRRSDAADLASGDRNPSSRATDEDAALRLSGDDRHSHLERLVGIVDRFGAIGPEVEYFVTGLLDLGEEPRPQRNSSMVKTDGYDHELTSSVTWRGV